MNKLAVIGNQIAALPIRRDEKGKLRVLMITSRDTGRWVMPKGWEMDGKKPWRAAEIEALEEAGVTGHIGREPIGVYHYDKILDDGSALPCSVVLYPLIVRKLRRRWKERDQRKRRWFSPKGASRAVAEPGLAEILRALDNKQEKPLAIDRLLKKG